MRENMWLYSMWFSVGLILFSFGHFRQCSWLSSSLKHNGHSWSFWLNERILAFIFLTVCDLSAKSVEASLKVYFIHLDVYFIHLDSTI